jgi:hypothetical protein
MTKEEGDHVKGMGMCDGQRPSLMVSNLGGKRQEVVARVVLGAGRVGSRNDPQGTAPPFAFYMHPS